MLGETHALSLYKPITKDLPRNHTIAGYESKIAGDISQKAGIIATSDTTSPLLVQGLSETIIPLFIKNFPFWAMLRKVPSNGLAHQWSQQTSFSNNVDPATISETGFVNDDSGTYMRKTTNIAVFAHRRSLPLKASLAGGVSGGPAADLMGRELNNGLLTLSRDAQNETLRYQNTLVTVNSGANGNGTQDPNGKFDANGFNGLRWIANNEAPPENTILVDISQGTWTDQRVLKAVHNASSFLWDKGGMADLIVCASAGSTALFADQFSLIRYEKRDNAEVIPGFRVRTVDTDQGPIPVLSVPGNSVGTYVINDGQGNPHIYQDMFLMHTEMFEVPYLGNPEPSVIRIPTAVNGNLVEANILYAMFGLAALAPSISLARIQLKLT